MSEYLILWQEWLPELLVGLWLSVQVTAFSLLWGVPLGLALALGVQSPSKVTRYASLALVEFGRGTPALIMLQFVYYGLPHAGMTFTSYLAAIVGLGFTTGAYTSEIIRGGLEAVPAGQSEAAASLGLTTWESLRFITLPQGLVVAVPTLLGFAISILQATSLCFTIALPEVVSKAYAIGATSFEYLPALMLAGLLYAVICLPATVFIGSLERRLGRHIA